jgi:carbon storage regulator
MADVHELRKTLGKEREEQEMLVLSRRIGESVKIGSDVTVTLLAVSGAHARLGISAPVEVPVHRDEVHRRLHQPKVLTGDGSDDC